MIIARPDHSIDPDTLPRIPAWVTSARPETHEDVTFLSGAALSHLHLVLGCMEVPQALLRARLALRAAEACVAFSGRPEREIDLRDAVHLLRPGDLPGPAGETCLAWLRAVERPVSVRTLDRALTGMRAERIAIRLDAGQGGAVQRVVAVMETALADDPRGEVPALILADAALAQALGWDHLVPLLAGGMTRADLRKRGADLQLACHRAILKSTIEALPIASDLARRAARLLAVAPGLRAKRAGEAVRLLLSRDAVAAAALPLPDRAARRLCDRLVELGAVRELTGRDTFRLYGL